ncbi:MAG: DNA polymerase/3'-5' exonuclease PolX [Candidatus Bathyarchaeia archaeon]
MKNSEVAEILYEIADFLEIKGVRWKPRAYRRAAGTIETLSEDVEDVYELGELHDIPGVGESIAEKIGEYLEEGRLQYLEDLREEMNPGLRQLMEVEGVGPKTAKKLNRELGVSSIEEMEEAAKNKMIRELEGFGKRSEEDILRGIEMYRSSQERFILGFKLPSAQEIVGELEKLRDVKRLSLAGSIRRMRPTIGDIDILVTVEGDKMDVIDHFTGLEVVDTVISQGERKSTVILKNRVEVDLMIIEPETFGAALQYFTGSKAHNIKLRQIALDRRWKLSEYGLVERDDGKLIAGKTEEEIYDALGLEYIEPELREDRGEIEAARNGNLPDLIGYDSLKGDLHTHSNWSEGSHTVREMAEAARRQGHKYIALCDHSKTLAIAQGLTAEDYRDRQKEIDDVNRDLDDFTILSGTEVEIDSEGKLDLPYDLLKDLDYVVAAIHSGFKQTEGEITNRLLSAMSHDHVDAIAHPTGRMLQKREPYEVNLEEVYRSAEENGTYIEINAFPIRQDLPSSDIMNAKEYNLKFHIGTDAHSIDHLRYIDLGIANARRGWLQEEDVINTKSLEELRKELGL